MVVNHNSYKVIEVYGDRWHKGENADDLRKKYEDIGYDCYVVWEHELKNSRTRFETFNKLRMFIFESSTTVRQTSEECDKMMIQSVLTGDSKSVAEMTTPLSTEDKSNIKV